MRITALLFFKMMIHSEEKKNKIIKTTRILSNNTHESKFDMYFSFEVKVPVLVWFNRKNKNQMQVVFYWSHIK